MIEDFKNQMRKYNIEDIKDIQNSLLNSKPEDLLFSINEIFPNFSDPKRIIKVMINSIPDKQRDEMLKIISSSPMAMDYFLNLKSADRLLLFQRIIIFYLSTLVSDKNKISLIK